MLFGQALLKKIMEEKIMSNLPLNIFKIDFMEIIGDPNEKVESVPDTIMITEGAKYSKPWLTEKDTKSAVYSEQAHKVHLQAERKASKSVADAFKAELGGSSDNWLTYDDTPNAGPTELYFFFQINITINGHTDKFYIACGPGVKKGTPDVWWVGYWNYKKDKEWDYVEWGHEVFFFVKMPECDKVTFTDFT